MDRNLGKKIQPDQGGLPEGSLLGDEYKARQQQAAEAAAHLQAKDDEVAEEGPTALIDPPAQSKIPEVQTMWNGYYPDRASEAVTEIIQLDAHRTPRTQQEVAARRETPVSDEELATTLEEARTEELGTTQEVKKPDIGTRIQQYLEAKIKTDTPFKESFTTNKAMNVLKKLEDAYRDLLDQKQTQVREYESADKNSNPQSKWQRLLSELKQDPAAAEFIPDGVKINITENQLNTTALSDDLALIQSLKIRLQIGDYKTPANQSPRSTEDTVILKKAAGR